MGNPLLHCRLNMWNWKRWILLRKNVISTLNWRLIQGPSTKYVFWKGNCVVCFVCLLPSLHETSVTVSNFLLLSIITYQKSCLRNMPQLELLNKIMWTSYWCFCAFDKPVIILFLLSLMTLNLYGDLLLMWPRSFLGINKFSCWIVWKHHWLFVASVMYIFYPFLLFYVEFFLLMIIVWCSACRMKYSI